MVLVKDFKLSEITKSRFTKILLTFYFKKSDTANANYDIVMETYHNGKRIDWRGHNISDYHINKNGIRETFLPFRFELIITNSKNLADYSVKIYLWNVDKKTSVKPVKCVISAFEDNPYIYGTIERVN